MILMQLQNIFSCKSKYFRLASKYKYITTPIQVDMEVAIGIIIKPSLSKKLKLIDTFKKTIKEEMQNGSLVLSLAKKKFAKTFISEKATTPYPKNFKAIDVIKTSLDEKEPYPNNPLTISSDAKIKARLAGKDKSKDNSIDLF